MTGFIDQPQSLRSLYPMATRNIIHPSLHQYQNKIILILYLNSTPFTMKTIMKNFLLSALFISVSVMAFGQSKMACCAKQPSATQQFAMLASNKKFVMSHAKP